ncbi:BnaA03g46580D [Brassica napus]|uniref:BnaA03g46580D protein n=1 Tax=Brassica napus TaxID=3708 RepID=A0A078FDH5_BRANA|nr:BnaA03g46580D [Brassica napus]
MEEKKLADDRVSDEQVKITELMVSDVDARDTEDEVFEEAIDSSKPESFQADDGLHEDLPSEEVKVPEVNGESHGEANLQHIATGEAVPGFVTSQMNGDEGEAGVRNVSETATLSFSENGIVSPEKKAVLLSFGRSEKKLGDDRIIHDQVENNILLVSDVDARDTYDEVFVEAIDGFQADDGLHEDLPSKATPEHSMDDLEEENSNDKEVKDSKVSGETHGEANLQHITEGEAAPGFVTSKMNGDEGESGAEHVNEKVTCSFSENGIVSPEKKQLVAEVIEETRNDGTEEENKEENVDVSAGMETEQEAGKREGSDKDCFENESGAQRNGETVAEYNTVKYASGDSIQVASGEKSLNDSIEVACAGTSSPLESKKVNLIVLNCFCVFNCRRVSDNYF